VTTMTSSKGSSADALPVPVIRTASAAPRIQCAKFYSLMLRRVTRFAGILPERRPRPRTPALLASHASRRQGPHASRPQWAAIGGFFSTRSKKSNVAVRARRNASRVAASVGPMNPC
jgi:hypothetical protein